MLNSTGTSTEDIDGLINYARRIEDVRVAALIHEIKNGAGKFTNMNRYHVSLRSDSSVDVAKIANKFGGGGHTSAAGFQIESTLVALKEKIIQLREQLEKNVMQYCYKLLDVDFPDRGFLLFWQLPLNDKLHYFDIEEKIAGLKNVADRATRKEELYKLLQFLGANPIEKVDKAFKEKYKKGILEYLGLS